MSIVLTGTGGLFTRLGKLGALLKRTHDNQANQIAAYAALFGQYNSDRDLTSLIAANSLGYAQLPQGVLATYADLAAQTIIRMVRDDAPSQATSIEAALAEVIRQMESSADSVAECTTSATVTTGSANIGTGNCVATNLGGNGKPLQNLVAEVIVARCTNDTSPDFLVSGEAVGVDRSYLDWPEGSNASKTYTPVSPLTDATVGNLLTNGGFDAFTANSPNRWTIHAGVAGTDFLAETSTIYGDGVSSLKIVGGGTAPSLSQKFNDSVNGTSLVLEPNTNYSYCGWCRVATVPVAGVLTVELVGGPSDSSLSVINDDQAVANSATVAITGLVNNTWTRFSGVFRTPRVLPTVQRYRLRISTGISAGSNFFLDHGAFTKMEPIYTGGPSVAFFNGNTSFLKNDRFSIAVANNRASTSYLQTFQALFDRLLDMRSLGLTLPYSGSPTIADSLIQP